MHVLVKGTIAKLLPVMSWMFITFHWPVVSGSHSMWQVAPALYLSPGPGTVGFGSARTAAIAASRLVSKIGANILVSMLLENLKLGGCVDSANACRVLLLRPAC